MLRCRQASHLLRLQIHKRQTEKTKTLTESSSKPQLMTYHLQILHTESFPTEQVKLNLQLKWDLFFIYFYIKYEYYIYEKRYRSAALKVIWPPYHFIFIVRIHLVVVKLLIVPQSFIFFRRCRICRIYKNKLHWKDEMWALCIFTNNFWHTGCISSIFLKKSLLFSIGPSYLCLFCLHPIIYMYNQYVCRSLNLVLKSISLA